MIIIFSGIDGAGKSTQIDLLKKQSVDRGLAVSSIWSRGGYTPGFEFLKKILNLILGKKSIPSGRNEKRDKALSNPLVSHLWLMAAMFDLLILYAVIIRFKSFLGEVVVCDRYLGDTFIDFSLNFPCSNFEKMWLWRLLVALSPKPDVGLLFTLPVEESLRRSKLKNEPFPDSKETLENRLNIYQTSSLFKFDGCVKIDGLDSIDHSASIIREKVFSIIDHTNAS